MDETFCREVWWCFVWETISMFAAATACPGAHKMQGLGLVSWLGKLPGDQVWDEASRWVVTLLSFRNDSSVLLMPEYVRRFLSGNC